MQQRNEGAVRADILLLNSFLLIFFTEIVLTVLTFFTEIVHTVLTFLNEQYCADTETVLTVLAFYY